MKSTYRSQDRYFSAEAHSGRADGGAMPISGHVFSAETHSGNVEGGVVPTDLRTDISQQRRTQEELTVEQYRSRERYSQQRRTQAVLTVGQCRYWVRCFKAEAHSALILLLLILLYTPIARVIDCFLSLMSREASVLGTSENIL